MSTQTTAETRELADEYLTAWEDGDVEAVTALLAEDFHVTYEDISGTETALDEQGMADLMRGLLDAVTDLRLEIHDLVVEEGTAIVHLTYSGVHDGEMFGIEPTGNRLAVEEYITLHIEDGAIVDMDSLSDEVSLLRQLGADLPV